MSAYTSRVEESTFKLEACCRNVDAELVDAYSNDRHDAHRHARPTDHVSKFLHTPV